MISHTGCGFCALALRTHGITKSIFPAPKKLQFAKRTCNDELKHKIGEFMCVNDTLINRGQWHVTNFFSLEVAPDHYDLAHEVLPELHDY